MNRKRQIKVFGSILTLIVLNAAITLAQAEDIREGLVACWSFDDDTARDSVGTNHGEIIGPAKFEDSTLGGKAGKAITFNGTNNYVTVPDSPSLSFNEAVTISLWFNSGGHEGKFPGLVSKGYPSGEHSPGEASYSIHIRGDLNILVWEVDMVGKEKQTYRVKYLPDGSRVVDNSLVKQTYRICYSPEDSKVSLQCWTHVAATFDGTNLQVYVNGHMMKGAHDYSIPSPLTWDVTKAPLEIGHLPGWHCFKGMIDDVRLYNRALSAQEIKTLYQFGKLG